MKSLKSLTKHLQTQKIRPIQRISLISQEIKEKFKKSDDLDSRYIINMACEDYFKEVIDEYLGKILINGFFIAFLP